MGTPNAFAATDYTGIWKGDCSDYYAIQIKSAEDQMYSVSFCGLRSCFAPGEWAPNTKIEGDSNYIVISPTEIKKRGKGGETFSTYYKCDNDPTWEVKEPANYEPAITKDCSFSENMKIEGILIAWITNTRETTQFGGGKETTTTKVEPFRPLALIINSTITSTEGSWIYEGQPFWPVLSSDSEPFKLVSVGSFLDHMNVDHCVYFGTIENKDLPRWTLMSSEPMQYAFKGPTSMDSELFYKLNTTCIYQGNLPETCTKPKILAVSDINNNGMTEFWTTEPYKWDTGLTVWEYSDKLIPLLRVCVGCSD